MDTCAGVSSAPAKTHDAPPAGRAARPNSCRRHANRGTRRCAATTPTPCPRRDRGGGRSERALCKARRSVRCLAKSRVAMTTPETPNIRNEPTAFSDRQIAMRRASGVYICAMAATKYSNTAQTLLTATRASGQLVRLPRTIIAQRPMSSTSGQVWPMLANIGKHELHPPDPAEFSRPTRGKQRSHE